MSAEDTFKYGPRARFRFVAQKYETDCGVACVAMIAGRTWEDAALSIFGVRWPRRRGFRTTTAQLVFALQKLGIKADHRLRVLKPDQYAICDESLPTIVKVKPHEGVKRSGWHWMVVKSDKKTGGVLWFDPLAPEYPQGQANVWCGEPSSFIKINR